MQPSIAYLLMQMPAPSEAFLAVEVNALITAGVDIRVFCLRSKHSDHDRLKVDQKLGSVPIYFFPWLRLRDLFYWLRRKPGVGFHLLFAIIRTCWRRPTLMGKSLAALAKSFTIARSIQQQRIQVVHAAWGHYPAITGYLTKLLMPEVRFTMALGAYDRVMEHPMSVVATTRAECILTQSEASADLLRNHWPRASKPVFVIPRGVDLNALKSNHQHVESEPGLIVSVGRLIQVKGHEYVIQALAEVKKSTPAARLELYGEGEYRPVLERLVQKLNLSDSVEFKGHISQDELFRRISRANVFVLASESKADNIPNSVKEAMVVEVPVITTPTTGVDELIQDGVSGLIVPMGSAKHLAGAMIQVLTDPSFAKRLSERAALDVTNRFDLSKTTQERKRLFTELAAASPRTTSSLASSVLLTASERAQ